MRSLVRDAATGAVRAVRAVVGDALVFHGGERCNPPDLDAAVAAADGIAAKAMRSARANVIKRNQTDTEAFAYVLLNIYRLTAAQAKTLRRTAIVRACVHACVRDFPSPDCRRPPCPPPVMSSSAHSARSTK